MNLYILTLFPHYFESIFSDSILARAQEHQLAKISIINIRDFAHDKHHVTDDRPFGGGPGMVMKVEPIDLALASIRESLPEAESLTVILTSAKGKRFGQADAKQFSTIRNLAIICGHYEGVDERVKQHLVDYELRIGDFVMTGGEPAAACMSDAIIRLIPGVLGNEESTSGESHEEPGQLGYPQYTRPAEYNNWEVPAPLLTGDHAEILQWREENRAQADEQ